MVCPYDYLREVYAWLGDYLTEKHLKEFLRIFSMGFNKMERNLERRVFYRNYGSSHHIKERVDVGICELCENFSDNLRRDSSNRYVCENCRII